MANGTKILKCNCHHDFQDLTYGKGNRVHNETLKGKNGPIVWRCTVCSAERTAQ